ncbi:hypothetical protein [Maribacter sp.]|uniref:hypothetical protein n=1 Tax=Maribacter sp. TaxID=1897614 RepID=UPI003298037B
MNINEKTIVKYFDIIIIELDDASFFSVNNILSDNKHLKIDSKEEKDFLFILSDKVKSFGITRGYFSENGDNGWLKLTEKGIDLKESKKGLLKFKKSLKPKTDYVKWVGVGIAGLSLIWNIYQGITNNKLRDDNRILGDEIEVLEKENAGLEQLLKKAQE